MNAWTELRLLVRLAQLQLCIRWSLWEIDRQRFSHAQAIVARDAVLAQLRTSSTIGANIQPCPIVAGIPDVPASLLRSAVEEIAQGTLDELHTPITQEEMDAMPGSSLRSRVALATEPARVFLATKRARAQK